MTIATPTILAVDPATERELASSYGRKLAAVGLRGFTNVRSYQGQRVTPAGITPPMASLTISAAASTPSRLSCRAGRARAPT